MLESIIVCPYCGAENTVSPRDLLQQIPKIKCIECDSVLLPDIPNQTRSFLTRI